MPLNHTCEYAQLTDAQFAAIGRAVVEWANVEHLLGVLLSRLLATPEFLGRTYTDSMSAVRMQAAVVEAIDVHRQRYGRQHVEEELLLEISQVNSAVTVLRETRNKIAHFCWTRNNDNELFGTSFRGGVPSHKRKQRDSAILSSHEVEALNASAHDLVERLMVLISKIAEVTEDSLLTRRSSGPLGGR